MSIEYYALNTELYEPYWITDESIVCYDHIETILEGIQEYVPGAIAWIPLEKHHIEWKDKDTVEASGSLENLPIYIKIVVEGTPYYYYLIDRPAVLAVKNGKAIYSGAYKLDEYNTVFHHKLSHVLEVDPNVLTNRCFDNRWWTMVYGESYTIDFIKQRYLSNTIPNNNFMSVRELAYYTDADKLWALNFPGQSIPTNVNFTIWNASTTYTIPFASLKQANSRGRYEYIICRPSSLMSSANNELRSCDTKQKFIIIPLISGYQEQILHALNDFDIKGNHSLLLDPFGDNQIGIYECDVPFTMFVGYNQTSQYGVELKYIEQPMSQDGTSTLKVPFFYLNTNAPMVFKIVDYTEYTNGMYGKFLNFVNNITEWTPETEPALWNPTFYKEVYNNGNSNLVSDASRFVFKWTNNTITPMGVQCYLNWSDNLNIAYNYGELTNTALASLDNTESVEGNLSLANMYFGSAAANFFTQNATTTATNIQVRKSEQTQAWTDAALDSARSITKAAQNFITVNPFALGRAAVGAKVAAIDVARYMTDTAMQQDRANNQFRSSINNLMSSPAPMLSNSSTKGCIPNKNGLFATWGIDIHPNDKKIAFTDYAHNGYPSNEVKQLSKVFNRKIMNILNIDTTYNQEDLRNILYWNDDVKIFNTPYWNSRFLAWMNQAHKVYNTWWPVNCTDYYSPNYISNIEKELPVIPTPKTNIETLITNFRETYKAVEVESNVIADNPDAPADVWDDVEFLDISFNHFIIKTKPTSTRYFGTIIVNKICYNGYIEDGTERHYFYDADFLKDDIHCPDGKVYDHKTFNLPIVFNEYTTFTEIPQDFMSNNYVFNESFAFPQSITKINPGFLFNCFTFNRDVYMTNRISGDLIGFMCNTCKTGSLITISDNCTLSPKSYRLKSTGEVCVSLENEFIKDYKQYYQPTLGYDIIINAPAPTKNYVIFLYTVHSSTPIEDWNKSLMLNYYQRGVHINGTYAAGWASILAPNDPSAAINKWRFSRRLYT